MVHDWIEAQKLSSRPVKVTLPGPMTITDTIANEYYTSNKQLCEDLAQAINIEIKRLVDVGCKYIQVDEPLFARKPKQAIEYGISNLEKCFDSISSPDVEKITHICCGYPDKLDAVNYPKAPIESYNQISKLLDNSIIDCISIEDAHRYNDLTLLDKFRTKKIIIGLIKISSSVEETSQEINSRVKVLLEHIDRERLIAAPDCGLGLLPRKLAMKKLKTMVKAVKNI